MSIRNEPAGQHYDDFGLISKVTSKENRTESSSKPKLPKEGDVYYSCYALEVSDNKFSAKVHTWVVRTVRGGKITFVREYEDTCRRVGGKRVWAKVIEAYDRKTIQIGDPLPDGFTRSELAAVRYEMKDQQRRLDVRKRIHAKTHCPQDQDYLDCIELEYDRCMRLLKGLETRLTKKGS